MTDVLGPPEPGERFSSLPMFGPATAAHCSARSKLEVGCDMAQAFDIPCGIRTAANERSPSGVPRQAFQIAHPSQGRPRPGRWLEIWVSRHLSASARRRWLEQSRLPTDD